MWPNASFRFAAMSTRLDSLLTPQGTACALRSAESRSPHQLRLLVREKQLPKSCLPVIRSIPEAPHESIDGVRLVWQQQVGDLVRHRRSENEMQGHDKLARPVPNVFREDKCLTAALGFVARHISESEAGDSYAGRWPGYDEDREVCADRLPFYADASRVIDCVSVSLASASTAVESVVIFRSSSSA